MTLGCLNTRRSVLVGGAMLMGGCVAGAGSGAGPAAQTEGPRKFPMTVLDDRLSAIVAPGAMATVIASGFSWSEGPTWDSKRAMLYFSDIPNNRAHSWDAQNGLGLWRAQAGSVPAPEGVQAGNPAKFFQDNSARVADALLSVTDEKAKRAKSGLVQSTYSSLRGSAKKHVEAAVPRLSKLIEKHSK